MKTSKLPKAQENAGEQVMIGFSFTCDWLTEWRELSGPITGRSEAKTKQFWTTFDTRLKIALCSKYKNGRTINRTGKQIKSKLTNPNQQTQTLNVLITIKRSLVNGI